MHKTSGVRNPAAAFPYPASETTPGTRRDANRAVAVSAVGLAATGIGIGIGIVIWASAAFAGYESIRKLIGHGHTTDVDAGIAGAVIGIIGNQALARYKLATGRRHRLHLPCRLRGDHRGYPPPRRRHRPRDHPGR